LRAARFGAKFMREGRGKARARDGESTMTDWSPTLPELTVQQLLKAFMTAPEPQLHEVVEELRKRTLAAGLGDQLFEFIVREWRKAHRGDGIAAPAMESNMSTEITENSSHDWAASLPIGEAFDAVRIEACLRLANRDLQRLESMETQGGHNDFALEVANDLDHIATLVKQKPRDAHYFKWTREVRLLWLRWGVAAVNLSPLAKA
jgi:hypothetical protein